MAAYLRIAVVNSHYHNLFSHGGITCDNAISRQLSGFSKARYVRQYADIRHCEAYECWGYLGGPRRMIPVFSRNGLVRAS